MFGASPTGTNALLTWTVIVRSIFFFGLSSLLALYVGTSLHGGTQAGEAALTTMLVAGAASTVTGGRVGWLVRAVGSPGIGGCRLGPA